MCERLLAKQHCLSDQMSQSLRHHDNECNKTLNEKHFEYMIGLILSPGFAWTISIPSINRFANTSHFTYFAGWNKLWGWGARPPPRFRCNGARLDLCPPPHFLMASLYMVQLKFGDSGTMDSLSLNLRHTCIYYSFSDHSLKDNF